MARRPGWLSVTYLAELRAVLAGNGFRRLFASRLISQAGDGVITAAIASYAFFSAQSFPDPVAAADAFAVLYLPYSLIGPFAGVFIDRWRRRQILAWSAFARAGLTAVTAALVATGNLGFPLYVSALAVLGFNRFFLSAVSAGLPHVVTPGRLVMANSVMPAAGTTASFAGGIAALGARYCLGGSDRVSAAIMLAAVACYLLAGLAATTMRRDLLGPVRQPGTRQPGVGSGLRGVAGGLAGGARHVWQRRPAAYALGALASHRFLYGILFVMTILLLRNYFYPAGDGTSALGHTTLAVIASALGYLAAALITPPLTARRPAAPLAAFLLIAGGLGAGLLGVMFRPVPLLIAGFILGVVGQNVKICADTAAQRYVDDAFRGRVFSLSDMLFNAALVAGAAISAPFLPVTGRSYPLIILVAAGYVAAGSGYCLLSRRQPSPKLQRVLV